jgi:transcriptional regulator with XRE-family HTH domain
MKLRIRDLREDRDLTQKDVAKYLHCDQSLYSKYERQERDVPLHILVELALFYHTSLDYLAGLTNEQEPYTRITNPSLNNDVPGNILR